jgi:ABC-type nitrate/sulfonate/bicarbonate transport system substrate-binding protein
MLLALSLVAGLAGCASGPQPRAIEAPPAREPVQLKVVAFGGGFNWPLWVGSKQGYFARNGVALTFNAAPNVAYQLGGVVNGTFDIALATADDVIAAREGQATQGVDGSDLMIVMGGDSGFLKLASVPEVRTVKDLKGREIAVDSINSGPSFALREILERQAGLEWNRDYKTQPAGPVLDRFQLLAEHKFAATMLVAPLDGMAQARGLNLLADVPGVLGRYQGLVGAVRGKWARENERALVGFIRGYRQALAWLYDPANRDASIAIFRSNIGVDAAAAESAYRQLVDPVKGFDPQARVNEEGMQTVLRLHEKYARPPKKLQPLAAYYDPRYYEAAKP